MLVAQCDGWRICLFIVAVDDSGRYGIRGELHNRIDHQEQANTKARDEKKQPHDRNESVSRSKHIRQRYHIQSIEVFFCPLWNLEFFTSVRSS